MLVGSDFRWKLVESMWLAQNVGPERIVRAAPTLTILCVYTQLCTHRKHDQYYKKVSESMLSTSQTPSLERGRREEDEGALDST